MQKHHYIFTSILVLIAFFLPTSSKAATPEISSLPRSKTAGTTQSLPAASFDNQEALAEVFIPPPPAAPVAAVEPVSSYSGTGDSNLDWIVAHESGGNPYARNPSGACGLFQALPCSKLGCDLSNIACQIAWGRNYCISTYGSTYNARLFWEGHNWY